MSTDPTGVVSEVSEPTYKPLEAYFKEKFIYTVAGMTQSVCESFDSEPFKYGEPQVYLSRGESGVELRTGPIQAGKHDDTLEELPHLVRNLFGNSKLFAKNEVGVKTEGYFAISDDATLLLLQGRKATTFTFTVDPVQGSISLDLHFPSAFSFRIVIIPAKINGLSGDSDPILQALPELQLAYISHGEVAEPTVYRSHLLIQSRLADIFFDGFRKKPKG